MSGETYIVDIFEGYRFLNLANELAPRLNALRERLFFSQRTEDGDLTEYDSHDYVKAGETYQVFVSIARDPIQYILQDERQEDGTHHITLRSEEGTLHYRHYHVPQTVYPYSDRHEWECHLPSVLEDEERVLTIRLSAEGWEMIRQAEERYRTLEYQDEWDEAPVIPEAHHPLFRMYYRDFMSLSDEQLDIVIEGEEEEDSEYEDNDEEDEDDEDDDEEDDE